MAKNIFTRLHRAGFSMTGLAKKLDMRESFLRQEKRQMLRTKITVGYVHDRLETVLANYENRK